MAAHVISVDWGGPASLYYQVRSMMDDSVIVARTNVGVVESPAGSRLYVVTTVEWDDAVPVRVIWDDGSYFAQEERRFVSPEEINTTLTFYHGAGQWKADNAITDGDIPVTHDTGGLNNLQYVHNGSPIEGGLIRAYRSDDYALENYVPRGETRTDESGHWTVPMYLTPGREYVFTFEKAGAYKVTTRTYTIPA